VQYAHARAQSVLRNAAQAQDGQAQNGESFDSSDLTPARLEKAELSALVDPAELALIRLLAGWPRLVEGAAEAHEPHRIAFYLGEVAASFHGLWNKGKDDAGLRFIIAEDKPKTLARLALVQSVAFVIASGLKVFGVTPVMEMR